MMFIVGAAAGAFAVVAVQRIREEVEADTRDSLADRMEEHLERLEERLGLEQESVG
jgi:hypothetical protein